MSPPVVEQIITSMKCIMGEDGTTIGECTVIKAPCGAGISRVGPHFGMMQMYCICTWILPVICYLSAEDRIVAVKVDRMQMTQMTLVTNKLFEGLK